MFTPDLVISRPRSLRVTGKRDYEEKPKTAQKRLCEHVEISVELLDVGLPTRYTCLKFATGLRGHHLRGAHHLIFEKCSAY